MKLSLQDIRRAFPDQDFKRGMEYYRQGRVHDLKCSGEDEKLVISCRVRGSEDYKLRIQEIGSGTLYAQCTCVRFETAGVCKHLAAAMIAYVEEDRDQSGPARSDRYAQALLRNYLRGTEPAAKAPEVPARLEPTLHFPDPDDRGYPDLSFRVGRDKLYAVKNIENFLVNVEKRQTESYGKYLTLDHGIEQFDGRSQKLIHLLMNEFNRFRTVGDRAHWWNVDPFRREKNKIALTGDAFDRFFDLWEGKCLETSAGDTVGCFREDPEVGLSVKKRDGGAELTIESDCTDVFFGSSRSLYALSRDNRLLRCSEEFRKKIYPLLKDGRETMFLAEQDLPAFCGCVLPEVEGLAQVEDPQGLLQEYLPEDCVPCFYFDMEEDTLTVKLAFRYGEQSVPLGQEPKEPVRRNVRTENDALRLVQRYFTQTGDRFTLNEGDGYDFLIGSLDAFRQMGEIYFSDRLANRRIDPRTAEVGLSVSDGLLTLTLDTGGFPAEELAALYQSLLLRKKYHRLSDGRYLELTGSGYEKVAEMAQMLQLSQKELAQGTVTMPAYRALYLDGMLSGSEGVQVRKDGPFREMVRNFKTLSDSDYALPEGLDGVLRPYQKTGFQWLKTLDAYGFGGILADEMGLGKTLQMISFLATVPNRVTGKPSLVVCPASLIYNWGEELTKFAPALSYRLILGTAADRKNLRAEGGTADVWVTSYELLRQDIADYAQTEFYACILDEAQHIKNASTLTSKAVKRIPCTRRFVLTGTPVENRLSELWNLFDFLMPGYLYTNSAFRDKLEKPILKARNEEAAEQLRRLVQPFLLRRRKAEVLRELPPKEEHIRRIPLSEEERKAYHACVLAAKEKLGEDQGKIQILAALTRLRQICCDPDLCFENYEGKASKLDACIELCQAMTENGHQILLFSQFTSMLDRIRTRLEAAGISSFTLQGSTSKEQRAKLVKAFNAGGAAVFLISLKAGGTGLNLTAADVVIHYDPWWNQAAQDQATDRAHRMGQQAHVQVYKLIAKGTIEEKILELQEKKAALMDTVAGAEDTGILNMSQEDLLALLDER